MSNKGEIADHRAIFGLPYFPRRTAHATRVSFVNGVCHSQWQTDRWTGRLTDNRDTNVADDTLS